MSKTTILRLCLTATLMVFVYIETGVFTTIALTLLVIRAEAVNKLAKRMSVYAL